MNSPGRIAIIAALPIEMQPLVSRSGWRADNSRRKQGISLWESERAVVCCGGMGAPRAALAFEAACDGRDITSIVSAGFAGALNPHVELFSIHRPALVISAQTGERYTCDGHGHGTLVTTTAIASPAEKLRLSNTYSAQIVDMEAATVARLALARGIPFRSIKSVSDAYGFVFPDLDRFTTPQGTIHTGRFALHALLHPSLWSVTRELARNSKRAARALCAALERDLNH
jgi:adenosylhomocysteine nucleosidase